MEGLVTGRIVYFTFDEQSAAEVMRRRTSGDAIKQQMECGQWSKGAQAHIGNPVAAGDVAPAMVVFVYGDDGLVNLKVELDGCDQYWAQSVPYDRANGPRTWNWMFTGQQKRYTPTVPV